MGQAMKKLLELLRRKSEETGYPLYWLLFYLPGFVLAVILIPRPLKLCGYLALLVTELWEIGMLHKVANRISIALLSAIVMHPLIVSLVHIFSTLFLWIGVGKKLIIADDVLLRLRLGYVIAAYVGIMISVFLKRSDDSK